MNDSEQGGVRIGFAGLLTLIFITLKLTGLLGWSWVWVLAPIWISLGLWLAAIVIILLIDR